MASTTNYGLIKPDKTDYFNIEDFNGNADIVDQTLKGQSDEISALKTAQVNTNQTLNDYQEEINELKETQVTDGKRIGVLEDNLYNPNLLINSNLKVSELVNQRGDTIYNTVTNTIDMWRLEFVSGTNSLVLTSDYAKLKTSADTGYCNIMQGVENIADISKGNKLTVSAMVKSNIDNGVVKIGFSGSNGGGSVINSALVKDEWTFVKHTSTVDLSADIKIFVQGKGEQELEIKYIKLEVGEVATKFVDDDKATKLAKCQRYLQLLGKIGGAYHRFGMCKVVSPNSAEMIIYLTTSLRTIPTLIFGGKFMLDIAETGQFAIVTNIVPGYFQDLNKYAITINSSGLTTGQVGFLRGYNDDYAYILLSAEL